MRASISASFYKGDGPPVVTVRTGDSGPGRCSLFIGQGTDSVMIFTDYATMRAIRDGIDAALVDAEPIAEEVGV